MLGTNGLDAYHSCWLGQVGGGQRVFDMCTRALKVMIHPVCTTHGTDLECRTATGTLIPLVHVDDLDRISP